MSTYSNRIFRKAVFTILTTILSCSLSARAQTKRNTPRQNGEKLITALIDSENVRGVFGDDGMYIFMDQPEIQRIVSLRSGAIPLLVRHLDDTRLLNVGTNYPVDGERVSVTVGAACLDILTLIIRQDSRFFDKKCLKNLDEGTISGCLKTGYGIYPEDFWRKGKLTVRSKILKAKHNWLAASNQNLVHFKAPE